MELLLTFGFPLALFLVGLYLITWFRGWEGSRHGASGTGARDEWPKDESRTESARALGGLRGPKPKRIPVEDDEQVRREAEELRRALRDR